MHKALYSRKSISAFLILPAISVFLSGCWDMIEITDLAAVTAAGIDRTSDGMIKLSVQVFNPQGKPEIGRAVPEVLSASGVNISDAAAKLQAKTPRLLFWGHNEVLIIGDELAREDVRGNIEFFTRFTQTRGSVLIFVSKTKAIDILKQTPKLRGSSSESLEQFDKLKFALDMKVGHFGLMLSSELGDAFATAVHTSPQEETNRKQTVPAIAGVAVFREGKLVGYLDNEGTKGLQWFLNNIGFTITTVAPAGAEGQVSVKLLNGKSNLVPRYSQGRWQITVKGNAVYSLIENASRIDLDRLEATRMLEEKLSREIEKNMNKTLESLQKKMKSDILGFGEAFHRKYPKLWNKEKKHWNDIFPTVKVEYDITVKLMDTGKSTTPISWPEKEVEQ